MVYGHRNDIKGYANALAQFDRTLGEFIDKMRDDDLIIITADHVCDPGFIGTDHTRENVPLLAYYNGCESFDAGGNYGFDCIADAINKNFNV